jgi:hypothetical protein
MLSLERSVGISVGSWDYLAHLVNLQLGSSGPRLREISEYSTGIFFVRQLCYLLMVSLRTAALIAWAIASAFAPQTWRPALGAALGASILQLGLWLVIMPPLIMFGIRIFMSSGATLDGLAPLLENIQVRFGVQLLFTLAVAVPATAVLAARVGWTRSWI